MTSDTAQQPNTHQHHSQPISLKQSIWKAIFIPLLIPLLIINLAPIAIILLANDIVHNFFANIALFPSLFVTSIVNITVILIYNHTYHPQGMSRTIINTVLIALSVVLFICLVYMLLAFVIYLRI